jgi:hypothetical protein
MEQEEVQVQYNGQVYTLRVPKGMPDAEIQSYLQKNVGQQAAPKPTNLPGGAATAYGLSTANSLLFGVPEMAARGLGAGPYINQVREEFPKATTAGDITGLISPTALGAKIIGGGLIKGGSKVMGGSRAPEAVAAGESAVLRTVDRNKQLYETASKKLDDTEAFYRANPDLPDAKRMFDNARKEFNDITKELDAVQKMAAKERGGNLLSSGGRVASRTAGGIMGLQTGAGMLGGARSESYGPGFQQGSETAGQAVREYNPLQFVPGVPQVTSGVTSVVPGLAGYGSLAIDSLRQPQAPVEPTTFDMDRRIREEAFRRSMGLQ